MSDLLGVTEPCATPNLCWLILVGRMREETGFKTYLWLFGYSIKPCLGSPCTFLGLQSPQSPGHLLSLKDFLLHALLENFLHITSRSVKSQGILPLGCRMSFIRIFLHRKGNFVSKLHVKHLYFCWFTTTILIPRVSENRFSVSEKSVFLFIPVGVDPLRGFE